MNPRQKKLLKIAVPVAAVAIVAMGWRYILLANAVIAFEFIRWFAR